MQPENLTDAIRQTLELNARRQAEEAIETQIKVLAGVFDKAAAYSNLMILAGYAGYFGLWQLTKEYLTKPFALWSALLILCSLVVFVFFEVTKMVFIQHNIAVKMRATRLPEAQRSPQAFQKAMMEVSAVYERVGLHLHKLWVVCLCVTISTAMAGTTLLAYCFVSGLAK